MTVVGDRGGVYGGTMCPLIPVTPTALLQASGGKGGGGGGGGGHLGTGWIQARYAISESLVDLISYRDFPDSKYQGN